LAPYKLLEVSVVVMLAVESHPEILPSDEAPISPPTYANSGSCPEADMAPVEQLVEMVSADDAPISPPTSHPPPGELIATAESHPLIVSEAEDPINPPVSPSSGNPFARSGLAGRLSPAHRTTEFAIRMLPPRSSLSALQFSSGQAPRSSPSASVTGVHLLFALGLFL